LDLVKEIKQTDTTQNHTPKKKKTNPPHQSDREGEIRGKIYPTVSGGKGEGAETGNGKYE